MESVPVLAHSLKDLNTGLTGAMYLVMTEEKALSLWAGPAPEINRKKKDGKERRTSEREDFARAR